MLPTVSPATSGRAPVLGALLLAFGILALTVSNAQEANLRLRLNPAAEHPEPWTWIHTDGRIYKAEDIVYDFQASLTQVNTAPLQDVTVEVATLWLDHVKHTAPGTFRQELDEDEEEEFEEYSFRHPRISIAMEPDWARFQFQKFEGQTLTYNKPWPIPSKPLTLHKVLYTIEGSHPFQDKPIGMLARVRSADGKVLGTVRQVSLDLPSFSWEEIDGAMANDSGAIPILNKAREADDRRYPSKNSKVTRIDTFPRPRSPLLRDISLRLDLRDETQQGSDRSWTFNDEELDEKVTIEEAPGRFAGRITFQESQPLRNVKVEFATLWLDQIMLYEPGIYRNARAEEIRLEESVTFVDWKSKRVSFVTESQTISELGFGSILEFDPAPILLQRYAQRGSLANNPYRDQLVGLLIRFRDADGKPFAERSYFPDDELQTKSLTWEAIDWAKSQGLSWIHNWNRPPAPNENNIFKDTLTPYSLPVEPEEEPLPQPEAEWRMFTESSSGKEIEAKLLSYDDASLEVTIQLRDGRDFSLPISRLSIEDQVYIRSWISKSMPSKGAAGSISAKIAALPKAGAPTREWTWYRPDGYAYPMESYPFHYSLSIASPALVASPDVKVQIATLWFDRAVVYQPGTYLNPEGEEKILAGPVTHVHTGEKVARFQIETLKAAELGASYDTAPVMLQRVLYSSDPTRYSDEAVGFLFRVLDENGNTIGQEQELSSTPKSFTWETIDQAQEKGFDWIGVWDVPPLSSDPSPFQGKQPLLTVVRARSEPPSDPPAPHVGEAPIQRYFQSEISGASSAQVLQIPKSKIQIETFSGRFKGYISYAGKQPYQDVEVQAAMLWSNPIMVHGKGWYLDARGQKTRLFKAEGAVDWSGDRASFQFLSIPLPELRQAQRVTLEFAKEELQRFKQRTPSSKDEQSDRLLGVMYRILDSDGQVIGQGSHFPQADDEKKSFRWDLLEQARSNHLTWIGAWDSQPSPASRIDDRKTPLSPLPPELQ